MATFNAQGVLEAPPKAASPLNDRRVEQVIERMIDGYRRPANGGPRSSEMKDPHAYADFGFSIHPDQGELIYLLCRALNARRVVDFATSIGFSALYLAAAVRDNGGGRVIGAEIVPAKIATARQNLGAAGLADLVEIRAGDARATLCDLGGAVDFALIDGWPGEAEPSLSLEVMHLVAPQLRAGALVLNDNAEPDYLAFVRDPSNGFRSMTLPLKGGTELSVKAS
ncbi:MAG: class I SAM-dependent methyltransferase [Steroidobacteraceae bacterium]